MEETGKEHGEERSTVPCHLTNNRFCGVSRGTLVKISFLACSTPLESPLLSFADAASPSSSTNLFLGLEWPSLMPPFSFGAQEQILENQMNDEGGFVAGPRAEEAEGLGLESSFNLMEQNDDVSIDPDLLTLRPPRDI